ncbi:hypothetical protein LTR96_011261 [Exophiala xenobiotica]|nr:hypothetical protein LTR41_011475 [Exophiala xenobiotica]KAK5219778.1 hypothetical protein LTR47_011422 [Exophiala xenobiotica]KAK5242109.1 hypothetical protein LTS06_011731 [Exophiala xenobiotica]KAK5260798.1 hypothetical protein LTR40_003464 [Exophiala xenobiotica]KAK5263324.1 hypothetical protein LTR96_011261 [Exophiala xenobiotica]
MHGHVEAGNVIALMGPSGSGKTTLLNVLAHRTGAMKADIQGRIMINGRITNQTAIRKVSSYVEQEDAMIGILTVRETVNFAAKLSLGAAVSNKDRMARVNELIESYGLQRQNDTVVGTPLRKGISGGQKRRLSVASQLVTSPRILFLDEPTSGLDSTSSYEVMNFIRQIAKQYHLVVIASIHQPSTTTFELFDQLMLLSEGQTCYFGPVSSVNDFFDKIHRPIPMHMNPAEYLLDAVNSDFGSDPSSKHGGASGSVQDAWDSSEENRALAPRCSPASSSEPTTSAPDHITSSNPNVLRTSWILLHRDFIKSYRDIIAYGTRVVMYLGLAILMGTVWLRLSYDQASIQPSISAIFFGGAFMSFMAVAYVPSIIELQNFRKERANGLYGPLPFTIANALVSIPWLFLIAVLFSVIVYWLSNFRATAGAFWMWVLWLFLDLLAAEGLVVLVSSMFPVFVVSLAITAFLNGLWMSVGGFLVPLGTLNVFWSI